MPDWEHISNQLQDARGLSLAAASARPVGGGCINSAYVLEGAGGAGPFFIKINRASGLAMFEAEREGLLELARSDSLRVPAPLCCGVSGDDAFLVMEYLPLQGAGDDARLGEGLAALHGIESSSAHPLTHTLAHPPATTRPGPFGWHRDNTIGSTPQPNTWTDNWVRFWGEQRLGYQLRLAAKNGAGQALLRRGEQLQAALPAFFTDYQPVASLLHGDLWSGNYAFGEAGQPVIFDPAVYYGDREADLAMTELFGGFSARFYAAYQAAWPLDAGYATRKTLYNLYHILNHYNLFGGGYLSQAQGMVDRLLAEC
jgi:fructosamine-3-kinase